MKFGICTSLENAAAARSAGWDYLEVTITATFQGHLPDEQFAGVPQTALPLLSGCVLLPGTMKILGPAVDEPAIKTYLSRTMKRAAAAGTKTLVFGSGAARNVPDGFDRAKARQQIIQFATWAADAAQAHGVMMVVEALNKGECNIINSLIESMDIVNAAKHPNLQCLFDSYHFWLENEPLSNLTAACPALRHVHVADKEGRVPPGESGLADYKPAFRILKEAGYSGNISVEAKNFDVPSMGARVLEYLKRSWEAA